MKDIESVEDIKLLIDSFYSKVRADATIGFIFNDVIKIDWENHMPIMYSFWESVIFNSGNYHRNTMQKHIELNEKIPLTKEHFEKWLELFSLTISELFEGENSTRALQRAQSVATMIQLKIEK